MKVLTLLLAVCISIFCTSFISDPVPSEKKFTLMIDAAHGGKDAGFSISEKSEKDLVLKLSQLIQELNTYSKVEVVQLRKEDVFLELQNRASAVNEINPDLFISLHINGSENITQNGMEGIIREGDEVALKFGNSILKELENDFNNMGVKQSSNLFMLKKTSCPTIVLELGYLSNQGDKEKLMDEENLRKIANIILEHLPVGYS